MISATPSSLIHTLQLLVPSSSPSSCASNCAAFVDSVTVCESDVLLINGGFDDAPSVCFTNHCVNFASAEQNRTELKSFATFPSHHGAKQDRLLTHIGDHIRSSLPQIGNSGNFTSA